MSFFAVETLNFLSELRENNNRDWFLENKITYEKYAKNPFKKFVDDLIFAIQEFDPDLIQIQKQPYFESIEIFDFQRIKHPIYHILGQICVLVNVQRKYQDIILKSLQIILELVEEYIFLIKMEPILSEVQ